jgi:hypothetical protein
MVHNNMCNDIVISFCVTNKIVFGGVCKKITKTFALQYSPDPDFFCIKRQMMDFFGLKTDSTEPLHKRFE